MRLFSGPYGMVNCKRVPTLEGWCAPPPVVYGGELPHLCVGINVYG